MPDQNNDTGANANATAPTRTSNATPSTAPVQASASTPTSAPPTSTAIVPQTLAPSVPAPAVPATPAPAFIPRRTHGRGNRKNQAPIAPNGTVFLKKDNAHIDHTPLRVGKPDPKKTRMMFKDTKGNVYEHPFSGYKENRWDDKEWVKDVNKWRDQTFKRHYKRDPDFEKRKPRSKWTMAEKEFVEAKIKGKAKVSMNDWTTISKAHKERFVGTKVRKGEILFNGEAATTEQIIEERNASALKAMWDKKGRKTAEVFPRKRKERSRDALKDFGFGSTTSSESGNEDEPKMATDTPAPAMVEEDSSEEEESNPKKVKFRHGGDIDHHLEDPSDDEEDGQRPAAQPTGALLVDIHG